jgi:hypothetical protein
MRSLELIFAAPVPVGHRIEILVFEEVQEGLFTKKKVTYLQVQDLETEIVYGPLDLYWSGIGIRFGERIALRSGPREELSLVETITGRVTSCRLVTIQLGDSFQIQTTLVVEG